jgi:hypothetical protein
MSQVRPSQSDIRSKFNTMVYQALEWGAKCHHGRSIRAIKTISTEVQPFCVIKSRLSGALSNLESPKTPDSAAV